MNNRSLTQQVSSLFGKSTNEWGDVQYWYNPERAGWLWKQGEYLKTWRRRWFVMKQGRIYWFKDDIVTQESIPRGMIEIAKCLSIKGAEDVLHKEFAFELTTEGMDSRPIYFIADDEKSKEEWINAVGRAIVQHSKSLLMEEQTDYTTS